MPASTRDFLKYATKRQLQDIINRMYEAGGGTYEGAAYAYDAGPEAFNELVSRRNYLQRHPEAKINIEVAPEIATKIREAPIEQTYSSPKKSKDVPGATTKSKKNVFDTISNILGEGVRSTGDWIGDVVDQIPFETRIALNRPASTKTVSTKPPKTKPATKKTFKSFMEKLYAPIFEKVDERVNEDLQAKLEEIERTYTPQNIDLMNHILLSKANASDEIRNYTLSMLEKNKTGKGSPLILADQRTGSLYYFDGKKVNVVPVLTPGRARNIPGKTELKPLTEEQIIYYENRGKSRAEPELPGLRGVYDLMWTPYSWADPKNAKTLRLMDEVLKGRESLYAYSMVTPKYIDPNDPYLSGHGVAAKYMKPGTFWGPALHFGGIRRNTNLAGNLSYFTPGCTSILDPKTADAWENLYNYIRTQKLAGYNPMFGTFWDLTGKEGY